MAETLAEHLSVSNHVEDLSMSDGVSQVTVGEGIPVRIKVVAL
jgi:hypothetical protein